MALQVVSGDNVVFVVVSSDVVFSGPGSVVVDGCPGSTVVGWMLDICVEDTLVVLASPL